MGFRSVGFKLKLLYDFFLYRLSLQIIYPLERAGHKPFYLNDASTQNLWEKIGKILRLGKPTTVEWTEEVMEYKKSAIIRP